jgi:hypothetical protein
MPDRRRTALELLTQLPGRLAHIRVAHVHLSEEVVGQAAVVVEPAQVRAAHIADLQLLVPGRPGRILEVLQVALADLLLVFGGAGLVQLAQGDGDGGGFAEHGDF